MKIYNVQIKDSKTTTPVEADTAMDAALAFAEKHHHHGKTIEAWSNDELERACVDV